MRNFFYNLRYRYSQFMLGRYGVDELNIFLIIASLAFSLLSRAFYGHIIFTLISWVCLGFCVFRMYSKNIAKRYEEKEKFLKVKTKFMSWLKIKREAWQNRKTHKYFRCKVCKTSIRIPRGVGKVAVNCPKCRAKIIKKA